MRVLSTRLAAFFVLCALFTACDSKPSTPSGTTPAAGTAGGTGGAGAGAAGNVAPAGGANAPKALGPM
jgi:hypothetical protein